MGGAEAINAIRKPVSRRIHAAGPRTEVKDVIKPLASADGPMKLRHD